jgi:hypothetical protein
VIGAKEGMVVGHTYGLFLWVNVSSPFHHHHACEYVLLFFMLLLTSMSSLLFYRWFMLGPCLYCPLKPRMGVMLQSPNLELEFEKSPEASLKQLYVMVSYLFRLKYGLKLLYFISYFSSQYCAWIYLSRSSN